ncbi:hypothetical protein JCGZ_06678 [Jatropha curcas]|uniref:Uncharacterized protein n=1 Tax=Jatropha curcas TaxID=180498 RepID=A0A067LCN7_JATCU|nr:hypothetical protein JCGZ_06678 [Jatropha curcas]
MPPRYKGSRPTSSVVLDNDPLLALPLLLLHPFHLLSDEEEAKDTGDANMEEGNLTPFGPSFCAGTSGVGPSFQGTSSMSNDEVLAWMMSRMEMLNAHLNGMESMIVDRFQSIEIMHGSLNSRMDTFQGQLHTVIQLLLP